MDVNTHSKIIQVGLYDLLPHPYQPRADEESDIEQLANSIAEFGLLNKPKVVIHEDKKSGMPGKYFIVAGHRRVRALKKLGLQVVDVELLETDDPRVPLVDNMFRRAISPVELAVFLKKAIADEVFISPESICASTGMERFYVDILIELSKLPDKIHDNLLKHTNTKTLNNITILAMLVKLHNTAISEISTTYVIGAVAELARTEAAFGFAESDAKDTITDAISDLLAEVNASKDESAVEPAAQEEDKSIFDLVDEEDNGDLEDFEDGDMIQDAVSEDQKTIKDIGLEVFYDDGWDEVLIRIKTKDMSSSGIVKLKSVFDKINTKLEN